MENQIEQIKQQHFNTYKSAIIETIKNNTNVLTDEDLTSLLKKPPLDSMDLIKSKFLSLAKKNKIVLNTEGLSTLLDNYREELLKCTKKIKKTRNDTLISVVDSFNDSESVIKLLKKDFNNVNKSIRKILKDSLEDGSKKFFKKIDQVFVEDIDSTIKEKIIKDIEKFINGIYERQMIENVDIKILIKDTTLMNLVKEQTERYLFTISNSRLFKDNI
ncbi:MAG: hypothetical protein Q4E69_00510 [Bacilli bacterium]|nr:hypothetical protein [Bacilli bacterium]